MPSIGADRHRSPLPLQAAAAQEKAANAEATSAREAAAKAAAATASTSRELSALRAKFKAQSAELTRLVGHQNPNQKIQLHNRIKTENNELREELKRTRNELHRCVRAVNGLRWRRMAMRP